MEINHAKRRLVAEGKARFSLCDCLPPPANTSLTVEYLKEKSPWKSSNKVKDPDREQCHLLALPDFLEQRGMSEPMPERVFKLMVFMVRVPERESLSAGSLVSALEQLRSSSVGNASIWILVQLSAVTEEYIRLFTAAVFMKYSYIKIR